MFYPQYLGRIRDRILTSSRKDGTPETKHDHTGLEGDGLDWRTVWHGLREVNPDKDKVGRMT